MWIQHLLELRSNFAATRVFLHVVDERPRTVLGPLASGMARRTLSARMLLGVSNAPARHAPSSHRSLTVTQVFDAVACRAALSGQKMATVNSQTARIIAAGRPTDTKAHQRATLQ